VHDTRKHYDPPVYAQYDKGELASVDWPQILPFVSAVVSTHDIWDFKPWKFYNFLGDGDAMVGEMKRFPSGRVYQNEQ